MSLPKGYLPSINQNKLLTKLINMVKYEDSIQDLSLVGWEGILGQEESTFGFVLYIMIRFWATGYMLWSVLLSLGYTRLDTQAENLEAQGKAKIYKDWITLCRKQVKWFALHTDFLWTVVARVKGQPGYLIGWVTKKRQLMGSWVSCLLSHATSTQTPNAYLLPPHNGKEKSSVFTFCQASQQQPLGLCPRYLKWLNKMVFSASHCIHTQMSSINTLLSSRVQPLFCAFTDWYLSRLTP